MGTGSMSMGCKILDIHEGVKAGDSKKGISSKKVTTW